MTATSVNGVAVIKDEPTPAPIKLRNGKPVLWQQTRTLQLADGSTTYGCQHCDYTSDNPLSIRPHLSAHRTSTKAPAATGGAAVLAGLQDLVEDRDQWRDRALKAEVALRKIRKGLGLS